MREPFRFEEGRSFLHRLHPLGKLLCLALLSAGIMEAPLLLAALAALACLGGAIVLRIRPAELLQEGRFLAWLVAFVFLLSCVDPFARPFLKADKILPTLAYCGRLCCLFLMAEIFFRSTRVGDIGREASRMARRLLRRKDVDPGIYLALAVDFIPRAFSAYRECADAAAARGFGRKGARLRALRAILVSYMVLSIKKALRTSEALEARCYSPERSIEGFPAGPADYLSCVACAAFLTASFLT